MTMPHPQEVQEELDALEGTAEGDTSFVPSVLGVK